MLLPPFELAERLSVAVVVALKLSRQSYQRTHPAKIRGEREKTTTIRRENNEQTMGRKKTKKTKRNETTGRHRTGQDNAVS